MKQFVQFIAKPWPLALILVAVSTAPAAELSVERTDGGAKVEADGKPFAEYVARSGHQPIIWPIYGPDETLMTRSYPMTEPQEHEEDDHPHHRSLWFNHGVVNGHDFWVEPRRGEEVLIKHLGFDTVEATPDGAKLVARNDWIAQGEKICEDKRTILFGARPDRRWIDFTVEVTASEADLNFGDTKEGSFGIRVPGTMKVTANQGGQFVNSRGQVNGEAWGQPAPWINYTGPVEGNPAGIAMLSHPDNFQPECRWHAREYGLLAANPFGLRHFTDDELSHSGITLTEGSTLKLRYRVVFHRGDLSHAQLESEFGQFAASD